MRDPQDDILIIAGLILLAEATTNGIIAEHATGLADEIAHENGLQNAEDAVAQMAYLS